MDNRPPSKKRMKFTIDNILGLGSIFSITNLLNLQSGSGSSKEPKDYVDRLETTIEHNRKFKYLKSRSKFLIKELPKDPEELLSRIFQYFLNEAVTESRGLGLNPEQIGCVISSELLDHDVWIPVRARNENTVEAILNRFLLVAQSFKQKDVSLWGQPFNVMATVVDKSALPKQQQLPGSGRNKKIAPVRHRINNRSLIQACLPSFN
uniref:Uncharacterized protein n=2 Tax=Meloidogyne TaxID=189290 RepID=A0A6V7UPG7_MELEN|nr:unnamed protein product [Meloidogyne enterolobii]